MCFKENFIRLCNNSGKSPSSVCHAVGISAAAFAQWTEKTIPRQATLIKIADYFGVTPESLLAENEQKKRPCSNEQGRKNIIYYAEVLSNAGRRPKGSRTVCRLSFGKTGENVSG